MIKKKINWMNASTFLSTVGALIVVLFTYLQLKEFHNSTKADFAHRFKIDFFTEQSCTLMTLFDYHLLKFEIISNKENAIDFGYFRIDTAKTKELEGKFPDIFTKANYTSYEIDNYLLNHFNDLGQFYKGGVLDIGYVYTVFDYYVESLYENEEIKKYMAWVKTDESSEYSYGGFDFIYQELKNYKKSKTFD